MQHRNEVPLPRLDPYYAVASRGGNLYILTSGEDASLAGMGWRSRLGRRASFCTWCRTSPTSHPLSVSSNRGNTTRGLSNPRSWPTSIGYRLIGSYRCLEVLCGVSGGRSIAGSLSSSTGDVFLDARWSLPALPSRRQAAMIYRRLRDGLEDRVDHMNHMSHNVS